MTQVIYTAYFIDDKAALLRKVPILLKGKEVKIYADHVTKEFKPKNGMSDLVLGQKKVLFAFAQVITDRIQAVLVKDANNQSISTNTHPHITIATAYGTSPKESNDAIAEAYAQNTVLPIDPAIEIQVIEGYFDGENINIK